jgi:multidrug efflux pump subunit AcrA (membrane-fusion protein)
LAIDKTILNQQPLTSEGKILIAKNVFAEHGNAIDDIISNKLPFIVRWGTVLFLFLLVVLSSICWFIKYPDIVMATARLTSINAPKQIISLVNGKLIKLSVKEGDEVQKGKVFGFIESTAWHDDVLRLDTTIKITQELLKNNLSEDLPEALNDIYSQSQLGELQQPYQVLSQAFLNYKNYGPN